ncbi:MAG: MFS transporter [Actinobacteria bacterium]|nr:MFS transporter [Micrococcales bacterium]MCB9429585.1 MFS transporter [Actinomycetota bacterium]MCO5300495.1 MFS transporter [Candidatus Nanopelagicales bacterium]HPQ83716.1 MFS transporter [Actinomycetota bacterium]
MTAEPGTEYPALTGRKRWVALLFLAFGVAMIILDATVVNVAIPTMVEDLDLTTTDAEWVNSIYSLVFASLLLLSGRLSDIVGRRFMFLGGVTLFAVASVLVASSESSNALIGARGLQGIGAAMILPSSLSVLNAVYRGKDRAIAFAVWGATIGGMAAMGPLVGGWLTTNASWHWAFLINVPIALAVFIGVLLMVPETKDTTHRRGIDVPGALLGTLGLAALVFGLIEGQNYGWFRPKKQFEAAGFTWPLDNVSPAFVSLVLSALLLLGFVWLERRRKAAGQIVLLDLGLFRIKTFGMGNAVAALVSLGEFGLLFILPLFLQSVIGYDALETGVILLALAAGSFLASGLGAPLAKRFGPVPVLRLGMALEVIGVLWLALIISVDVTGWAMAPGLFIYGAGVGFATAQLAGVILSEVPIAESGQASAVQSTSRQVGAAIGTALLGAVLITGFGGIKGDLTDLGVSEEAAVQVTTSVQQSAGTAVVALPQQPDGDVLFKGASEGFATAVRGVGFVAAGLISLGLLAAFFLPRNAARTEAAGYVE